MRDGCAYSNDNLNWFEQRFERFLYVDRIVVDAAFAGRSLGRKLYEDAFAAARTQGLTSVVCEYTYAPRNEPSEKFHARMGFIEVGQRTLTGTNKIVSMQQRHLDNA